MSYRGGCHCGRVRFEVLADKRPVFRCNCSMCQTCDFLHWIVPKSAFKLVQGEKNLSCYQFGTKTAHHLFCKFCGIKSFYVPRSNPEGYSVNVRCLDGLDAAEWEILPFNGKNWEKEAKALKHLSEENGSA